MSKRDSKNNELPDLGVAPELTGLIHKYYDRLLADSSLSDLDVILLSQYLTEAKNKKAGSEYDNVRELFVRLGRKADNFPANIYLAKKQGLLEVRDQVLNFTIVGLSRIRRLLGQVEKAPVHVIKSGQSFSAMMLLERFLSSEIDSGEILLCDPHVSATTFYPFAGFKGKITSLKILTSNIYDSNKFNEYKSKLEKETGISIEVRLNKKIHDRYLMSGEKCWSIGASIKDLGNKDTTIRELSEVASSMRELFEERWNET
ncbi:MAG: hypothetical protein OK452_09045 [Thaumarchaeota archaeon]|nr:hypothetical protein [Nitrososphaerota archaeon]